MNGKLRFKHSAVIFALVGSANLPVALSFAEPVLNQVLSGAQLKGTDANNCPVLRIGFNFRIGYVSHYPRHDGMELRIKVKALDRLLATQNILVPRESARVPFLPGAEIRSIEFEANGSDPSLIVFFANPVAYKVRQGDDFTSINISIGGQNAPARCLKSLSFVKQVPGNAKTAKVRKSGRKTSAKKPERGVDAGRLTTRMAEARIAIAKQKYRKAAQLLTRLTGLPKHKYSAEAQELLGVVRERNGQIAHAKAEYSIYLKKYPGGTGAARVRQRLAAIATAESELPRKLRKAKVKPVVGQSKSAKKTAALDRAVSPDQPKEVNPVEKRDAKAKDNPNSWVVESGGSISQFYYRNQEFNRLRELQSRRTTRDDDVFQNSLVSALDMFGSAENNAYRFKWRFSGSHGADFVEGVNHSYRISSLFGEVNMKEVDTFVRVGRQTRNTGGILGRFDGGLVSWQAVEKTTLNLVVGSPVDSSRDEPFKYNRIFYGASVDFEDIAPNWDLTLFALEQRIDSIVDRRNIGTEVQYTDEHAYLYGSFDYDLYFNKVNSALLTASYTFDDYSTLSGKVDYIQSPNLSLLNALQGQAVNSLDELRNIFSVATIRELAIDRTTETWSANLTYSRPINKTWQVSLDGTVFNIGGNPASGGVAAVVAPGTEYFASTQLIGSNLIKPGDITSITARYANTVSTDLYLIDAYERYPYSRNLRLRPRVKIGYRDLKRASGKEIFVNPSFTTNYIMTKKTSFEFEVGGRWFNRDTLTTEETGSEVYVVLGYRHDF